MIRAFGRFAGKWWLHQLGGYQQREQLVGAMCIFRGLRVMGVRSFRWREDELEARLSHASACTLLMALAAQLATCSGSHAGCTQGICMLGSAAAAYSARSSRINRVRVMGPRSDGARDSRSSHDLHAAHDRLGKNRHVYGCTVSVNVGQ